jgi:hypothetical protein
LWEPLSFSGIDIGRIISPKENSDLIVEGMTTAVPVSEKIPPIKIPDTGDPMVGLNKYPEKNDKKFDYFNDWSSIK